MLGPKIVEELGHLFPLWFGTFIIFYPFSMGTWRVEV